MDTIAVGVDGSQASKKALRWAIDHASPNDVVRAVYVWQVHRGALPDIVPIAELQQIRPHADRFLDDVVAGVVEGLDKPHANIERVSYYGHPAKSLVNLSDEVDLIVVGSRGSGGFKGVLLGSVSTHLVHHACCPVVVVPPDAPDTEG